MLQKDSMPGYIRVSPDRNNSGFYNISGDDKFVAQLGYSITYGRAHMSLPSRGYYLWYNHIDDAFMAAQREYVDNKRKERMYGISKM